MTDKTEQKIIDAALKEFAEKGYKGATTRVIAEKAGFSELTLFRKFETKRNLYEAVLTQKVEEMLKAFEELVFVDKEFESPRDFLNHFIKNLAKTESDHFDIFLLSLNSKNEFIEPMMEGTVDAIRKYIEKNIPGKKIDYRTFGLGITSFIYVINQERYRGRTYLGYEDTIDKFIDNLLVCIQ